MPKSKLAVIQDDILAVKHALANNIEYEGLKGEHLNAVLSTLVAQRANEAAATTGGGTSSSASSATPNHDSSSSGGTMSRVPVNASRPKAAAGKKSSAKSPTASTSGSASKSKSTGSTSKRTATKSPPPKSKSSKQQQPQQQLQQQAQPQQQQKKQQQKQQPPPPLPPPQPSPSLSSHERSQSGSEKPASKKRKSFCDVLRQLRKSIKVGDHLSVLTDLSLGGNWEKAWVKGEVIREMNRSGIFQIAFEHDRYGKNGGVKQELGSTSDEEERWIHEQRLQIDHPDFFCGQGNNPPVGVDNDRPRGAWYLHQSTTPTQHHQAVSCSRTPHNLSSGNGYGGGSGSGGGGSSASPAVGAAQQSALPPSGPAAWSHAPHGSGNGHGAGSSSFAAAFASVAAAGASAAAQNGSTANGGVQGGKRGAGEVA